MRLGRRAAILATVTAAVAAMAVARRPAPEGVRTTAERFYRAAIDSQLALSYSAAFDLTKRALRADPTYLPSLALLQQRYMSDDSPTWGIDFVDSLAARIPDRDLADCYHAMARYIRGYEPPSPSRRRGSAAAQDCQDYLLTTLGTRPPAGERFRAAERLMRRYPGDPRIAYTLYAALSFERQWEALADWGREWSSPAHPLATRAIGFAARELGLRDPDSALTAAVRDWKRPEFRAKGFRVAYLEIFAAGGLLSRNPDKPASAAFAARVAEITEANLRDMQSIAAAGDPLMRVVEGNRLAVWFLDRGRLDESVAMWAPVIALADSIGDAGSRAYLHMRYGRTLVKLGNHREAERELLLARRLVASADRPEIGKEIEHNLFHLYDAERREGEAEAAGAEYERLAALHGLHGVRMGSRYDLGMFFRARGQLERSRRYFELMLADVDSLRIEWNFAGEYYELTGELDRARDYYERSLREDSYETRAQAGLVRLALQTGDDSAAVTYARLHDAGESTRGIPESTPLLPRVLGAIGRADEARAALDSARVAARRRGQVAAWASLTLERADLSLAAGDFAQAAALADSAAADAARVASTDVTLRARATAAMVRARNPEEAGASIRSLADIARAADRMSGLALRAEVRRDFGDGLASTGRWREALAQYSIAANLTDSIARRIALDPAQAGYRSVQRGVSDAAMAVTARYARGDEAVEIFEQWSARRKGRAYGDVAGAHAAGGSRYDGPATLDIAVLKDSVAVAVSMPGRRRLVTLPVGADSLRSLIRSFVARTDARVGSRIDESHAVFPANAAHALYQALIEPVRGEIEGARSLTIIPDGPVWLVPFDALVILPPAAASRRPVIDTRFLVDDYAITIAPAPGTGHASWAAAGSRIAAFVPGLDSAGGAGAADEARAIARAMPADRSELLQGRRATEAAVRALPDSLGVIHFATHAIANEQDPSMSWLALSAAGADDGRLHAFEIEQLQLHGALVVLNACETATGRALEGEGVLSLSRSFLRAGASATIGTLWPVGAGAGPLMKEFYAGLARGKTARDALRAAKLARRAASANPFDWGPYVYVAMEPRMSELRPARAVWLPAK